MQRPTINLCAMSILIADSSFYLSSIVHSILRGFGAKNVLEARDGVGAAKILAGQKIDVLLCDVKLPPHGGLAFTREIRSSVNSENRMVPIFLMVSDTREATIRQARDAGANMVIARPMSPAGLYDRLARVAFSSRRFVDAPKYFGPDRRFRIEGGLHGVGRRKGDTAVENGEESGTAMSQDEINALLSITQKRAD